MYFQAQRFALLIIAVGFMAFSGCNKIKEKIAANIDPFDVQQESFELTIPPTSSDSLSVSGTYLMNIRDSIIRHIPNGIDFQFDLMNGIFLKYVTIEPVSGFTSENNFTDFSQAIFSFHTNIGMQKGRPLVWMGRALTDDPAWETTPINLDFLSQTMNLKEYFTGQGVTTIHYGLEASLREAVTQEMKVKVTVMYQIKP
jgi:hypothetical protein